MTTRFLQGFRAGSKRSDVFGNGRLRLRAIEEYCISHSATIREEVALIDRGTAQVALVTEADRLIGMVTDGDVRRGLLRGESLDAPLATIMRRDFWPLPANETAADALALVQRETLNHVPAVDLSGSELLGQRFSEVHNIRRYETMPSVAKNLINDCVFTFRTTYRV